MGIINKIYAVLAAFFVVVLGAFSIHMRAKKEGEQAARAEDAAQIQKQAAEARAVVKTAKENNESKSDEQIKQRAKSKYVRGAGDEN